MRTISSILWAELLDFFCTCDNLHSCHPLKPKSSHNAGSGLFAGFGPKVPPGTLKIDIRKTKAMKLLIWRVSFADTNVGEAAILRSIIDDLCKTSDVDITILSELPEITKSRYPNPNIHVLNSNYRKPLSVIRKVYETDIFIWAGGHLFHDEVSSLQVVNSLIKLSIPVFLNKRVFIWGAEFGPLRSGILKFFTTQILKRVSSITVRNPESLEFCCELSPRLPSVHLTT